MAGWIVSAVLAGWIVSYRCISGYRCIAGYRWNWNWIVSAGFDWIIMAGCKDGTDGTDGTDGNDGNDGLDGALVGLGWTVVRTLRNGSDRTVAPPLAGWLLQTRDEWDRWT